MRRVGVLLVTILGALALRDVVHAAADIVVARPDSSVSRVYAYGHLLESPYVFSGVGSDTLLINGFPIWPARPTKPLPKVERGQIDLRMDEIRPKVHAAIVGADSETQGLAAAAETLRHEPDVDSAWAVPDSMLLKIQFNFYPEPVIIGLWGLTGDIVRSRAEEHQLIADRLRKTLSRGGWFAFGDGYRLHFGAPKGLELVSDAERVSAGRDMTTTGRTECRFVADLARSMQVAK